MTDIVHILSLQISVSCCSVQDAASIDAGRHGNAVLTRRPVRLKSFCFYWPHAVDTP